MSRPSGTAELAAASAAQAGLSFVFLGLPAIGPELRESLGLSLAELGALLAALPLGSGVALIGAGTAVARLGPRRATLAGTLVAVAGLLAGVVSGSLGGLSLGLFVAGFGGAVIPVAGASAIFRTYPVDRRGWALGVRQMAVPLGGVIAAVTVPQLEAAGSARLVLGVGAAVVALTGVAFAAVSDTAPAPAAGRRPMLSVWRTPGIQRLFAVTCLYIVVLQAVLTYTVPAVRAAGFSAFAAGAAYLAVNLTAMVSRIAWGRIADRSSGTRRVRTLVETGLVATVGGLLFTLALHLDLAVLLPATIIFGFGALGWNALVYAMAGEWAAPELTDRSFALAATVVFAAAAAVNPALGALAELAGWDVLWLTTAGVALAGTMLATTLQRIPREAEALV